LHKKILLGSKFKPKYEIHLGRVGSDNSSFLQMSDTFKPIVGLPNGYTLIEKGIIDEAITEKGASILELPNYSRLVTDCAKMQYLDKLLAELSRDNHRVLIFC
jgi:SNF2 family DNA or RNA helicase